MNSELHYRCIGRGFCGSVWALETGQHNASTVVKREDGGPGRSITDDYNMHLCVLESALQYPITTPLAIPRCKALIQPTDTWWEHQLQQFPNGYSACRALSSERIPKVPRRISDKIVDLFCAGNAPLASFVKTNADDDACLIRAYLGRRRHRHQQKRPSTLRFQRFTLRNVPLHIDQMEALGLDTCAYAEAMAEALALMHWGAQIDANDVEFVLAPPREDSAELAPSPTFQSDYLSTHCLWLLDFDCCRPITLDSAGVENACVAFFNNDPFYPRPASSDPADKRLWKVFRGKFLAVSQEILMTVGEDVALGKTLMERIEEEGLVRSRRKEVLVRAESKS